MRGHPRIAKADYFLLSYLTVLHLMLVLRTTSPLNRGLLPTNSELSAYLFLCLRVMRQILRLKLRPQQACRWYY